MDPGAGHCNEMGTASTMACVDRGARHDAAGHGDHPGADRPRAAVAEATGRRAVELAPRGPAAVARSSPPAAFDNAITVLMALGGSTNAVIHLLALARRAGFELPLDRFDELVAPHAGARRRAPAGAHLFEKLDRAGGVPARDARARRRCSTGRDHGQREHARRAARRPPATGPVVRPLDDPSSRAGGLAVLRGIARARRRGHQGSAASPRLLRHRGRAVVFEDIDDVAARIDDPSLDIDARPVLVLRNAGPKGAPGMPEWGMLPIPERLLQARRPRHGAASPTRA